MPDFLSLLDVLQTKYVFSNQLSLGVTQFTVPVLISRISQTICGAALENIDSFAAESGCWPI
jgi:hypothetical protein